MATYLVTGGCGFIGSHLADNLIEAGHRVVILDDLSTGKTENAPKSAEVIIGDAVDPTVVEKAFKGIDGCFHLAAVASVERSNEAWAETHKVNITATVNIFEAAKEKKLPVVYTSSAAVYGDHTEMPLSESMMPRPLTAYGADKYSCELHGRVAWMTHQIPTAGARPFNIYGPRQDPKSPYSGVISIFADRMLAGKPYRINGDGKQTRDFVYVQDIVRVFMALMAQLDEGCAVYNVCTGKETSIAQLADTMERLCDYKGEREYGPARLGDARASVGTNALLKEAIGFVPQTPLEEGLKHTLNWLRQEG
ncbi:MAG: NAD-dependent epimerase/dehydratase family protein [Hyphomicrobiales bacterium]|nr:NAD-dependent epimerase/dehydratase family protein [Rickettsiales bacterium]MCP5361522.1 NAD-dependent epimerase/dehydratase family protein [Hyphomicrobiales bacterium]